MIRTLKGPHFREVTVLYVPFRHEPQARLRVHSVPRARAWKTSEQSVRTQELKP